MHGSAIALLHFQTENKRVINLKKKKNKPSQEIQPPKLQLLISPLYSERASRGLLQMSLKLMDLLWIYIRNTQDTTHCTVGLSLPYAKNYIQWHSNRANSLYVSPHYLLSSPFCRQQEDATTPSRSGLMFLPSASPTLVLFSLGQNPPSPFCFTFY